MLALGAGAALLMPATRRFIGPGLTLGAVATAPNAVIYNMTFLAGHNYGEPGVGLRG